MEERRVNLLFHFLPRSKARYGHNASHEETSKLFQLNLVSLTAFIYLVSSVSCIPSTVIHHPLPRDQRAFTAKACL